MAATAALLALSGAGLAQATPAEPQPVIGTTPDGLTYMQITQSDAEVRSHWTPERIASALANPLPSPDITDASIRKAHETAGSAGNGRTAKSLAPLSADAVAPLRLQKTATPASLAAAGAGPTIGDTSHSELASNIPTWQTAIAGKLLFYTSDGRQGSCTAAAIVAPNKNSVWTAGHCLHQGKGGTFYKNFIFIPGYDHKAIYGWWVLGKVIVSSDWANDSDSTWGDMGGGIANPSADYGNLQDWIGAYGYRFNGDTDFSGVTSLGYPVDAYNRSGADVHDGEQMMYCHGNVTDAGNWNPLDDRLQMNCDMGHGSSGGPIVTDLGGNSQIIGTNSHRHADSNGNWTDNYLFSSNHGSDAAGVINWLNTH
ncbi:peptidase [Kitasatospora paracochleata]|uniref:V8-like Glu-specific endopeptidase n=1 Tax=Kitasatospora paracochleata TaxID=58354 RepID=A0ABT1JAT7_9ACTN|nr:hypothetical protein [Kitasatospora paracochleata]MCP2314574.1 V8-like Glu-specific endopeptidase [Kitasatospora paracochleata]